MCLKLLTYVLLFASCGVLTIVVLEHFGMDRGTLDMLIMPMHIIQQPRHRHLVESAVATTVVLVCVWEGVRQASRMRGRLSRCVRSIARLLWVCAVMRVCLWARRPLMHMLFRRPLMHMLLYLFSNEYLDIAYLVCSAVLASVATALVISVW